MDLKEKNPLFADWAERKFADYLSYYLQNFDLSKHPAMPPRKGIKVNLGGEYPIPLVRFEAAVWSVLYGSQFKGITHSDILASMALPPPAPKLFRDWRSKRHFKKLVIQLKTKFSKYVATNIFLGSDDPLPLPYSDSIIDYSGLLRKYQFIKEALNYCPDLLARISDIMTKFFDSGEDSRKIDQYIGHHMWCIALLYMFKNTTKKSPKRPLYLDICKKIIGRHWAENTLCDYLGRNTSQVGIDSPQKRWRDRFRSNRSLWQKSLDEGLTTPLLVAYFNELKSIIIAERALIERDEKGALSAQDNEILIHYLVGTGEYGMYRPDLF